MRALARKCIEDGQVILLIDFSNAFNACNRNLLMKLAAAAMPEISSLVYWLYAEETELFLSNGEKLISSEGVHKGCGLANLLFALLMRYVMKHIPNKGVSAKGSYWDDAFTKSTPTAALSIFKAVKRLEEITGLTPNATKTHIHAPNEKTQRV